MLKWALRLGLALVIILVIGLSVAPGLTERSMNKVLPWDAPPITTQARVLHDSLAAADLHSDSLLWRRDLLRYGARGHVDVPRLQKAGVALQVFSAVTKSPSGQNYDQNSADGWDNITNLAMAQLWPTQTWDSRTARAVYQAEKLAKFAQRSKGQLAIVRTAEDMRRVRQRQVSGDPVVGAILAIEGAHAMDGDLANLATLDAAGYRVIGIAHFFDNAFGGSIHGTQQYGLTDLGRAFVAEATRRGIIIDVAHASVQATEDVLAMETLPLIYSHGGVKGTCDRNRNISDGIMDAIATTGGLIGIGYWEEAVCAIGVQPIVDAIVYVANRVGVDHVALGSDFDGAVATPFDTTGLIYITQGLIGAGFSDSDIAKIMGGNQIDFFSRHLPQTPPP